VSKSQECRCCDNFGPTSGRKKWYTVLSNYKADVNETWQLWLQRDVV